jgi:xanthine dehydrogenase accessory factor
MEVWRFIYDKLEASQNIILLWVLNSEGSSPGRRGFKMAVATDESFCGTIGGGMMEHKLVEKAKALLATNEHINSLVHQYHDKQHNKDQSGMICSGSQQIAFVSLSKNELPAIKQVLASENNRKMIVYLSPAGIELKEGDQYGLKYSSEANWNYSEAVDQRPVIHIIGGGHVGLALSELMSFLGFYINIYDNRTALNTMQNNCFAHEKHIVDYQRIGDIISENAEEYVVIVTFGYRDDKIVFKQLLDKDFFYLGMMGSDSKIETLLAELEEEGINPEQWKHCFVPIGINIYSKTTREIAVSIAAEIIREKNKGLPTGRGKRPD